jgi:hypothetical protein
MEVSRENHGKNPRKTIGNLFVYGYLWMFSRKIVFSMCD